MHYALMAAGFEIALKVQGLRYNTACLAAAIGSCLTV
jgi:hypothetical protein